MKQSLKNTRSQNRNVILSAEEFEKLPEQSIETWERIKNALSPYENNTHVVVTYRHLHELLLSFYYEAVATRRKRKSWEGAYPSFVDWLPNELNEKNNTYKVRVSTLIEDFNHHFQYIEVFDFHGNSTLDKSANGDLVTRFVCQQTDETCEVFKSNILNGLANDTITRSALTDYIHCDGIAMAAYKKHIIPPSSSRIKWANKIQQHMMDNNITFTSLPLLCPSEKDLNTIRLISIAEGIAVFGQDFDKDALSSSFESYLVKKKYCVVDTDKLLQNDEWIHFFNRTTDAIKKKKNEYQMEMSTIRYFI